jgi:hypothetical protein
MNNKQENKLTMYDSVLSYLNSRTDMLNQMPALKTAVTDLHVIVNGIKEKANETISSITGKADLKAELKEQLILKTAAILGAVKAYARRKDDTVLKAKADVTRSQIKKQRDTELAIFCKGMFELVSPFAPALTDYGVTSEDIDEFEELVKKFDEATSDREAGVAQRKSATSELVTLFESADDLLEDELDALMEKFRQTDNQFFNAYQAARVIKDLGHRFEKQDDNGVTPAPEPEG